MLSIQNQFCFHKTIFMANQFLYNLKQCKFNGTEMEYDLISHFKQIVEPLCISIENRIF